MKIHLKQNTLYLSGAFVSEALETESYLQGPYESNTSYLLCYQELTGINTFFVAWLVGLQRTLHQQGSDFTMKNPSSSLTRLIKLYRLENVLNVTFS